MSIIIIFGTNEKNSFAKRNKNNKPSEWEECHPVLETLINEIPLGLIVTPPNKATYSDTNNLTLCLPQLLSNFSKSFFSYLRGFSNYSHKSIPSHLTIIKQGIPNNFVDFNNISSFGVENQIIPFNQQSLECDQ